MGVQFDALRSSELDRPASLTLCRCSKRRARSRKIARLEAACRASKNWISHTAYAETQDLDAEQLELHHNVVDDLAEVEGHSDKDEEEEEGDDVDCRC
eukprot:3717202-Rhodomonas_salina.1